MPSSLRRACGFMVICAISALLATSADAKRAPIGAEAALETEPVAPRYLSGNAEIEQGSGVVRTIFNAAVKMPSGLAPEAQALQYLANERAQFQLGDVEQELVHHMTRTSAAGNVVRFRQTYQGVPVHGGNIAVTLDRDDTVTFVVNDAQPNVSVASVTPAIPSADAKLGAMQTLGMTGVTTHETNDLVIYRKAGADHLAHRVVLHSANGPNGEWEVMIDAQTGAVLAKKNLACYVPVDGSGFVWDGDPLSTAGVSYGGQYVDNNDATNGSLDAERQTRTLKDIDLTAGTHSLKGPYAELQDFESPFRGLYPNASSTYTNNRFQDRFEAVNVYYHVDTMMRYINETLGCTVGPYQYGTGVRFDPHGLNGADNSYYLTSSGRLSFGEGGVDDSEDADVIIHELGHGLHDWITGGNLSQVNGLSEGTGDFFATSYDRALGHWTSANAQYYWVFNWDGHNPFWGGRTTNYGASYPGGLTGSIHTDGQIWATCLMRIYDKIGRELIDKAVIEGLASTGSSTNQNAAANAVFQAALNMG